MKIVFISFLYNPELGGGAAKVVYDLTHGLEELGNEVSVITTTKKNKENIYFDGKIKVYEIYAPNIYWIYDKDSQSNLRKVLFQLIDLWNPFLKTKVKKILQTEKPEIFHSHKLRGLSPSIWSAAKEVGVPKIIHTCHDYELISPQGTLFGTIGNLSLNRNFPFNIYQKIRSTTSKIITNGIAPSNYLLQKHVDFGFFPNAKLNVIANTHGYRNSQILENKLLDKPKSYELKLLYLGRIVQEKGIALICEIVSLLGEKGLNINLDVVGNGDLDPIIKLKYKNSPNIKLHGQVFDQNKNKFLTNCDLLIFPSSCPESFGIVITEAFAFGKPVIASKIGAIPEIIQDNYNGFLFMPNNKAQLQEIILKIYKDRSLLNNMRENCLLSANKYCFENFLAQHLSIYND